MTALIAIALTCLFVGFIAGGVTLAVLGSSANADRDCYWQQVAKTLARWAWAAAHSHNVSQVCHDTTEADTLDRAVAFVNAANRSAS